ncbi:hypothetical protein H1R85_00955, partial [Flavobacterium psychrophilum]
DEKCKPYLEGKDVHRYNIGFEDKYLQYDENIMSRPTFPELHENKKILIRAISDGLNATYDEDGFYIDQKLIICCKRFEIENYITPAKRPKSEHLNKQNSINDLSILALLNSNLCKFYYNTMLKGGVSILPEDIRNFPIFLFNEENQQPFIEKADLMLTLNKTLQQQQAKVVNMLQRDYGLTKPTKKLDTWYELTVQDFFKELAKAKIVLSAIQKDEVQEYFETYQKQAVATKSQITATDKKIDAMVYELYGLSNEEIEIVENS